MQHPSRTLANVSHKHLTTESLILKCFRDPMQPADLAVVNLRDAPMLFKRYGGIFELTAAQMREPLLRLVERMGIDVAKLAKHFVNHQPLPVNGNQIDRRARTDGPCHHECPLRR
jgi:hypothetical protein